MNDRIEAILKTLPDHPGVYLMKDKDGEIIYVGKAISLKNRVRQYFHSHKNHSSKVIAMVRKIEDIQYILVDSEMEALILECNLIKKYRPHYNTLMRTISNTLICASTFPTRLHGWRSCARWKTMAPNTMGLF